MEKKLQNLLRRNYKNEMHDVSSFTGLRDIDLIILSKLEDDDLFNLCRTNKAIFKLCQNDYFWMNRLIEKYPYILKENANLKHKEINWKELYFWTQTGLRDNFYSSINIENIEEYYITPSILNENMKKFLLEANLGLTDPNDLNSLPLNFNLTEIAGISTYHNLVKIIKIYFYHQGWKNNDSKHSTDLMNKYLYETLDSLGVLTESNFDKNNFITLHPRFYFSFMKDRARLSEKEKKIINTYQIRDLVKKEDEILKYLTEFYYL